MAQRAASSRLAKPVNATAARLIGVAGQARRSSPVTGTTGATGTLGPCGAAGVGRAAGDCQVVAGAAAGAWVSARAAWATAAGIGPGWASGLAAGAWAAAAACKIKLA